MMTTFLLLVCAGAVVGGLVGLCAGWLARGRDELIVEKVVEVSRPQEPDDAARKREQAKEILAQLQRLTLGVSAKIDAHTRTVGDINQELTTADGEGEAVVTAIKRLVESNTTMQSQLKQAQQQLDEQQSLLEAQQEEARTDPLTKLRNRRAFDDEMQRRAQECARGKPLAMMLLDVDHFKKFNDTYGHPAGDEVLRTVGRVLAEATFERPEVFAARYGGEEFALVFGDLPLEVAAQIANHVRAKIEQATVHYESLTLNVTASGGVAAMNAGETVSSFIARTDEALYAAKKTGRNCACVYRGDEIMKINVAAAATVEEAVRDATAGEDMVRSLSRRIAEWRRGGVRLALIVARLDNLAAIEGEQGPEGRETAMVIVGEYLKRSLREIDQVAVVCGDALGVMLPTAKLVDAVHTAERLRRQILDGELDEPIGMATTLSCGVAEVTADDDGESLLLRARRALESARRRGGNATFVNDGVLSKPGIDLLSPDSTSLAEATS
jgi:diguanylate cyclase